MTSERDPWADLAESLGASPGAEPQPPRAVEPPRPRPAQQPSRPRTQAATGGDWDGLASNLLGVDGDRPAASEPSEPAREPAPARSRVEQPPARERRAEQRHEEPITTSAWADEVLADTGNQAESPSGERGNRGDRDESGDGRERRGRRRRGRRGGRGRRDGVRPAADQADHRDAPGEITDEFARPREPRAADGDDDSDNRRDDFARDAAPAPEGEGSGDRPAGRRRRGRRGGRRRGRSTRERLAGERLAAEQPESEQRLDDLVDEPLATGYGATPRPDGSSRRSESERSSSGTEGERRGQRRRRRGSGESSSTASRREPGREGKDSGRRRGSDSARSSSRADRGRRRDDFTPVAGRFDEDDEGLEFLGVEEAGREAQGSRERRPSSTDESIAESGLDTVREVPSWVEAIGIVIAANLDARDKSTGGRK